MRIDHILDAIGNQIAAGQRIEHAIVPHGDAVIHRDGIKFFRNASGCFDFTRNQLSQIFQMDMPRHKLGEAVHHCNDGLAKIAVFHPRCAPKAARASHIATMGRGT